MHQDGLAGLYHIGGRLNGGKVAGTVPGDLDDVIGKGIRVGHLAGFGSGPENIRVGTGFEISEGTRHSILGVAGIAEEVGVHIRCVEVDAVFLVERALAQVFARHQRGVHRADAVIHVQDKLKAVRRCGKGVAAAVYDDAVLVCLILCGVLGVNLLGASIIDVIIAFVAIEHRASLQRVVAFHRDPRQDSVVFLIHRGVLPAAAAVVGVGGRIRVQIHLGEHIVEFLAGGRHNDLISALRCHRALVKHDIAQELVEAVVGLKAAGLFLTQHVQRAGLGHTHGSGIAVVALGAGHGRGAVAVPGGIGGLSVHQEQVVDQIGVTLQHLAPAGADQYVVGHQNPSGVALQIHIRKAVVGVADHVVGDDGALALAVQPDGSGRAIEVCIEVIVVDIDTPAAGDVLDICFGQQAGVQRVIVGQRAAVNLRIGAAISHHAVGAVVMDIAIADDVIAVEIRFTAVLELLLGGAVAEVNGHATVLGQFAVLNNPVMAAVGRDGAVHGFGRGHPEINGLGTAAADGGDAVNGDVALVPLSGDALHPIVDLRHHAGPIGVHSAEVDGQRRIAGLFIHFRNPGVGRGVDISHIPFLQQGGIIEIDAAAGVVVALTAAGCSALGHPPGIKGVEVFSLGVFTEEILGEGQRVDALGFGGLPAGNRLGSADDDLFPRRGLQRNTLAVAGAAPRQDHFFVVGTLMHQDGLAGLHRIGCRLNGLIVAGTVLGNLDDIPVTGNNNRNRNIIILVRYKALRQLHVDHQHLCGLSAGNGLGGLQGGICISVEDSDADRPLHRIQRIALHIGAISEPVERSRRRGHSSIAIKHSSKLLAGQAAIGPEGSVRIPLDYAGIVGPLNRLRIISAGIHILEAVLPVRTGRARDAIEQGYKHAAG